MFCSLMVSSWMAMSELSMESCRVDMRSQSLSMSLEWVLVMLALSCLCLRLLFLLLSSRLLRRWMADTSPVTSWSCCWMEARVAIYIYISTP